MTYTLSDTENAPQIAISKDTMESLVDRKIDLREWEEFCRDWDYLRDVEEAAADAFERFATNTSGSPPTPCDHGETASDPIA